MKGLDTLGKATDIVWWAVWGLVVCTGGALVILCVRAGLLNLKMLALCPTSRFVCASRGDGEDDVFCDDESWRPPGIFGSNSR